MCTASACSTAIADIVVSFDSRDACDAVIKDFTNYTIDSDGEEMQIQIRFADTQEQKSLKQQTQAARQFRSAEYEYATQEWRSGRLPYAGSTAHADSTNNNEFDQYLGTTAAPIQGQRWAQSAMRNLPGRSPLGAYSASQQPQVQINIQSGGSDGGVATSHADSTTDTNLTVKLPSATPHNSPKDTKVKSEQD